MYFVSIADLCAATRTPVAFLKDDDFMTVCLADNYEGVELILRIVLEREDIIIKSVCTQEPLKNLQGRSAILDVHAVDSTKKEFDVEIQRSDAGAGAKLWKK